MAMAGVTEPARSASMVLCSPGRGEGLAYRACVLEHALNTRPPSWIGVPRKPGTSTAEPKWRLRQSKEFIRYPPKTPVVQTREGYAQNRVGQKSEKQRLQAVQKKTEGGNV